MPLVAPLPADHSPEVELVARFFFETLGFAPNSVLTMQRRPEIAKAFTHLNRAVMENGGRVTSEQKRLIGHIASATSGCRYCEAHTVLAAKRFGASDEEIQEAVAMAALTRHWSTIFNGMQVDFDTFKKELGGQ